MRQSCVRTNVRSRCRWPSASTSSLKQLALREDLYFDELSDKGGLAVRYFAATLTDPEPTLIPARGELIDVRWCSVVSAQTLLKPARRTVLLAVLTELAIT